MAKTGGRLRQSPSRTGTTRRASPPSAGIDFHDLFENANDIVILNDRAGCIVMANRAARDFGGY